ncbi:hypothetical protein RRG08_066316 [Elysia crispata]|uniref:C-type lectin domain-containing protein n=1 Tax=Elysia crispata TaxID=231223 RepID=A0AAE1AT15_9GAST|nr:hypothetical protein RRG08_066316 [Elysia crispata]
MAVTAGRKFFCGAALVLACLASVQGCPKSLASDRYFLQSYKGVCYWFIPYTRRTWLKAGQICSNEGGKYLEIRSKDELDFIVEKMDNSYNFKDPVWLGLGKEYRRSLYQWQDRSTADMSIFSVLNAYTSFVNECFDFTTNFGGSVSQVSCSKYFDHYYSPKRNIICQFGEQQQPRPKKWQTYYDVSIHEHILSLFGGQWKEDSTEPADLTTEAADLTTEPADLTTEAADLTTEPADLTTEPADLTTEAADLTTEPADLTTEAADLTTEPADLTTEAADLTTEAADLTTEAADLTTEAADLTTEAADLTTEPADLTTEAADLTTEAADLTTEPADLTTEPADLTTEAADLTTEAADLTTEAADLTTEAADLTTEAADLTTEAADLTTEAADLTTEAVDLTTEAADLTTAPVDLTTEGVDLTTETIDLTTEPVHKPTKPVDLTTEAKPTTEDKFKTTREENPKTDGVNPTSVFTRDVTTPEPARQKASKPKCETFFCQKDCMMFGYKRDPVTGCPICECDFD